MSLHVDSSHCSQDYYTDSSVLVPISVRHLDGQQRILHVDAEMQVGALISKIATDMPDRDPSEIRLFLNDEELRAGSCVDVRVFAGAEVTCVRVACLDKKVDEVLLWVRAQKYKFNCDFRDQVDSIMPSETILEDLAEAQGDKSCLDALEYLSKWELQDEHCQKILDGLNDLWRRDEFLIDEGNDDDWTVEIAIFRCIGGCCPTSFAPKILLLCEELLDMFEEFGLMLAVLALTEVGSREKGILPASPSFSHLVEGILGSSWIGQGDGIGNACSEGCAQLARHAVVGICTLVREAGDPTLLQRFQRVVRLTAAREMLKQDL